MVDVAPRAYASVPHYCHYYCGRCTPVTVAREKESLRDFSRDRNILYRKRGQLSLSVTTR